MPSRFVTVEQYQQIVLVNIDKDRLTDAVTIAAVADDLDRQLEMCPVKISLIVDLSKVTAMSSQMLGRLVAVHKLVKKGRGRMCLTGVGDSLKPLFQVTKLHRLFDFQDEAGSVILAYQRRPL